MREAPAPLLLRTLLLPLPPPARLLYTAPPSRCEREPAGGPRGGQIPAADPRSSSTPRQASGPYVLGFDPEAAVLANAKRGLAELDRRLIEFRRHRDWPQLLRAEFSTGGGVEMTNLFFSVPHRYGSGIRPRVGVANASVVEVHQLENREDELWYRVGTLRAGRVEFEGSDTGYGKGMHPAVAVNKAGTVVAVHESYPSGSWNLHYHVGKVGAPPLFGDEALRYDSGGRPQVALNDSNVVVAVHQIQPGKVRYKVGTVDPHGKTISFGSSRPPSNRDAGWTPSIAINKHNVAIMVHRWKAKAGENALWYHVGVVDPDSKTISFGERKWYEADGVTPSIALNDEGLVIVVHERNGNLWGRIGEVDADKREIEWEGPNFHGPNFQYHNGNSPSVDIDGTLVVQVDSRPDQDDFHRSKLQCAVSMFIERASWMADNLDLIGNRKLMEIALPASHDAGMAYARNCSLASSCNTKTQNHNIGVQLQFGCRYFDIRPVIDGRTMRTGHFSTAKVDFPKGAIAILGCFGQTMAEVLDDVKTYLQNGRDLVILKFSHYFNRNGSNGFTNDEMRMLLDQVTQALQPFLYDQKVPTGGLQSVTVNDYIGTGGKVLAVFDKLDELPDSIRRKYRGVYSYAAAGKGGARGKGDLVVFDHYSNSNNPERMISDQLKKLTDLDNHGSNLFLLSWTLTQSKTQAVNCVSGAAPSILELTRRANSALWPSLAEACQRGDINSTSMPNLVYTDDIQGAQTDYVIALNREILGLLK